MAKIPYVAFDYFNLPEIPSFILCNPNKEQLFSLGGISERKHNPKFNAISEISFRADKYVNGVYMEYYPFLAYRRLVYIEGVDYFMITEVEEENDGIAQYKNVTCQSLEIELSSKRFTVYVSGSGTWVLSGSSGSTVSGSSISGSTISGSTSGSSLIFIGDPMPVTLPELLNDLLIYIPGWFRGPVPGEEIVGTTPEETFGLRKNTMAGKYRSFDVTDKTLYDLLMNDVEEAYNCVFDFDSVQRKINIYDETSVVPTSIYISHDNLIESFTISEVTDELSTCLNVMGGGGLDIRLVNPLGDSNIYNFSYFENIDWMSEDLINSLHNWENLVISSSAAYSGSSQLLYEEYDVLGSIETRLTVVTGCIVYLNTLYDAAQAAGNTEEANNIQNQINNKTTEKEGIEAEKAVSESHIDGYLFFLSTTASALALTNPENFTQDQYLRLQPFIIQTSYINDNITQSDKMSASQVCMQANSLYTQGQSVLAKVSAPRYTFETEMVNFLNIREFQPFKNQLSLGCSITIETGNGVSTSAILLGMDFNYDDPTDFKLYFGNRLRADEESDKFRDLMNKAVDAGNSKKIYGQNWNTFTRNYQGPLNNLLSGMNVNQSPTVPPLTSTPSLALGDGVHVSTESVNIVTPSLLWNGMPISAGGGTGGAGTGGLIMIVLFSGGLSKKMYSPDYLGLSIALGQAMDGDVVFLPDVDIEGNFSVPIGVSLVGVSSRETILRGQITMDLNSALENLYVVREDYSDDNLTAVIAQKTVDGEGSYKIIDCDIRCYQCGNGSTTAIYINSGVEMLVEKSVIIADSYGGNAYAFSSNGGNCNVFHSQYFAKTEVFHDI